MGGFFGEDGFLAFGGFVFFEFAFFLNDFCVVHGDEGVFAVLAVEDHLGVVWVVSLQDVAPE